MANGKYKIAYAAFRYGAQSDWIKDKILWRIVNMRASWRRNPPEN